MKDHSLALTGYSRRPLNFSTRPVLGAQRSHPSSTHDETLVAAIQSGDSSKAAPLHDRLRPSIERALHRVLKHKPADFEDLVQMTFERVVVTIAQERFEGRSQLTTWAHAIATHIALDWLRARRAEQRLLEAFDARGLEQRNFERQLEARAEVRRIQNLLHRMKRVNATALVLHDVYDHSVREVAQLLGISVSAAESRLRRARRELLRRGSKQVSRAAFAALGGA